MSEIDRILLLDDSPADAALAERELRKAGLSFVALRVETREDFIEQLEQFDPNLILADYQLLRLDGMSALALVKERAPRVPVVMFTGSVNEETAIECIKAGAADYVLKTHIARLAPAVRGAWERQQERNARERAERALRETEARFRAVAESASDAIIIADSSGCIVFWNSAAEDTFGYSSKDVVGQPLTILMPERFRALHTAGLERFLRTKQSQVLGATVELTGLRKDGSEFPIEASMSEWSYDDAEFFSGIIRDISERKGVEEELSAERNRAQQYLDVASVMLVVLDSVGRVSLINGRGLEILGYRSQEELLGADWFDTCLPAEQVADVRAVFSRLMSGDVEVVEHRRNPVVTRSGEQRMIAWHNTLLVDECGTPTGVLSSGEDVTERQRAEEAARVSEAEYRSLVEHANYGIFRSTAAGRLTAVNPALVDMLGYESAEELLEIDMAEDLYVVPADRERFIRLQRIGKQGFHLEVQWKRKDGKPITVVLRGRSVHGSDGGLEGFEAMAEDVTEQRKLEGQLRQAQKMEALGQLTSGIAHDFNNEMSVILLNAQMLSGKIERGETLWMDELGDITDAANRATEMTRQLVGFSRRAVLEPVPCDLVRRVGKLSEMLARILPENVDVRTVAERSVASVVVDPTAVEQMLLNLVTNARHAMPDGGVLTVRVWEADLDETYCRGHVPITPGRYVLLSVTDTGVGMDEETKAKIFEPFFTTKLAGEGTGLGMAMVYGLTKQQHGFVHVDSELGRGTTVSLAFPAVAAPAFATAEHEVVAEVSGGTETILLAEDEAALRRAGRRVLESHGYTVVTACDGEDALATLRSKQFRFDLIVTDLIMPKMGGAELCSVLEREENSVPVIITSGHSDRDVQAQIITKTVIPIVRKPWTVTELLSVVREVLDGAQLHADDTFHNDFQTSRR